MVTYRFYIPAWPVSTNRIWRSSHGKTYLSKEAETFRRTVADEIAILRANGTLPDQRITSPVSLTIRFYPKDKRKRDIDNLLKSTLDAFTHAGLWEDDSQIKKLSCEMMSNSSVFSIVLGMKGCFYVEIEVSE